MKKRKAFTLIELLIVVTIIIILASIVLIEVNKSRENARATSAKTSLQSSLQAIISCKDLGGTVRIPSGSETGTSTICISGGNAYWPKLPTGYEYGKTLTNFNSTACNFDVYTNGDSSSNIVCSCASQACK